MKAMDFGSVPLGIALLVIGFGLVLWKKKRKFDRTNTAGIEQFRSFGTKIGAILFDGIFGWMGLISLFAGVVILAIQFEDSWGWIVLLPLFAFVLWVVA